MHTLCGCARVIAFTCKCVVGDDKVWPNACAMSQISANDFINGNFWSERLAFHSYRSHSPFSTSVLCVRYNIDSFIHFLFGIVAA